MKKLFLSMVALVVATLSYAQSSLVATLSHEGKITTYYSASALNDAYNAAKDGDVITLSSGTFRAVDISKKITIRGAGMETNPVTGTLPTVISGDFRILNGITLEGIYHNSSIRPLTSEGNFIYYNGFDDCTFIKCKLYSVGLLYNGINCGSMKNCKFINCRISSLLRVPKNASVSCINSMVNYPENRDKTSSLEFTNCIVSRGKWGGQDFFSALMKNCIYMEEELKAPLDASVNLYNTVCVYATKNNVDLLANVTNNTNTAVEGFSNVFATYATTSRFPDDETFELTDAAKAKYLGLDGTQVGIYGGIMPFDPTVSGPQITKCNVASKSTADGKLSVDIEVKVNQ